jgi:hypothetical protein
MNSEKKIGNEVTVTGRNRLTAWPCGQIAHLAHAGGIVGGAPSTWSPRPDLACLRGYFGGSRTAQSTRKEPPRLGLPAGQQGGYGGSPQGHDDG